MIHILNSAAFAGVLKAPKVSGINPLFRANIRVNGERLRCYVKPLPDMIECPATRRMVENREVINEALGYVLADACGLKVPAEAGIILLDRDQIPAHFIDELRRLGGGALQTSYFCWFSQDMDHPNLVQKHMKGFTLDFFQQRRLNRLVKYITEAPDTPKVVAFDDWLLNSDRHPGNLLASTPDPTLIDHGRILVYPNWQPGKLGAFAPGHKTGNRLRNFIDQHEPKWIEKLPKKSEMIMAYNAFAVSFRDRGEAAARAVLVEFFNAIDTDAIIELLRSRHDPAAYAKASGMII